MAQLKTSNLTPRTLRSFAYASSSILFFATHAPDAIAQETFCNVPSLCPPTVADPLEDVDKQRRKALENLSNLGTEANTSPNAVNTREDGGETIYYNPVTDEFFVGDRIFNRNNHDTALETFGQSNTRKPEGFGWRIISHAEYINYILLIQGEIQPVNSKIFNNCVIAKMKGRDKSILREVRSVCREIGRNPSMLERWRWGE